ncbi:hypothetical protein GGI07_001716 [Coemansia sp. Benny D115]|nr:hypothetical protein GGI07_001716 [Coemansia sp. Benny D115]
MSDKETDSPISAYSAEEEIAGSHGQESEHTDDEQHRDDVSGDEVGEEESDEEDQVRSRRRVVAHSHEENADEDDDDVPADNDNENDSHYEDRGDQDEDEDEEEDRAEPVQAYFPRSEAPNSVDMNDALAKARAIAAKLGSIQKLPIPAHQQPLGRQPEQESESKPATTADAADAVGSGHRAAEDERNADYSAAQARQRRMYDRGRSRSPGNGESSRRRSSRGRRHSRSPSQSRSRSRSRARDPGASLRGGEGRRESRRGRFDMDQNAMSPQPQQPSGHGAAGGGVPMLEFQVPMSLVGLIIGRQGANLRAIEQRHGVRVQLSQNFDRRDPERKVTVEGPLQAAEAARQDILDFVDRHNSTQQSGMRGSQQPPQSMSPPMSAGASAYGQEQPPSPAGMTTIMVPNAKVGLIIGRGGESIRDIQTASGARVQVQPDNGRGAPERPIQLIGLPDQIEHARARIMEIVNSDRSSTRDGPGGFQQQRAEFGQGSQQMGGMGQQQQQPPPFGSRSGSFGMGGQDRFGSGEMQIPSEAVGIIIGRGGESIKMLQQSSGARIQIIQGADRSAPFKPVTISGDYAACMRARRMIEEKISGMQDRQGGGGSGGAPGYAGGRHSQYGSGAPAMGGYDQQQRGPMGGQGGYGAGAYGQQQQPGGSSGYGGAGGAGGYGAVDASYYGGQQQQQPQQQMNSAGSAQYGGSASGYYGSGGYQQQQQQAAAGGEQAVQWTNQQTAEYYAQYASTSPEYAQYAEYYRKLAEKDPHGIVPSGN